MSHLLKTPALLHALVLLTSTITANLQASPMVGEHDEVTISSTRHFDEQGGEALFKSVCQGCHMSDGRGAKGAAQYPALANDVRLAGAPYPIYMVLKGQGAMPGFANVMSDKQVADVVNYIRSHFGNTYSDKVEEQDVKSMR